MADKLVEKRLGHLYRLLYRAEKEGDVDGAAALRWAIFNLERRLENEYQ